MVGRERCPLWHRAGEQAEVLAVVCQLCWPVQDGCVIGGADECNCHACRAFDQHDLVFHFCCVSHSSVAGELAKSKKMADGGLTNPLVQNLVNAEVLRKKRMGMPNVGGPAAAAPAAPVGQPQAQNVAPTPQNIGATTGPIMKKGGKVKKGCK